MKRKAVSSGTAVGLLIVGLLIGSGAIYVAAPSFVGATTVTTTARFTATTTAQAGLTGTITIGDIVALTGDLSSQGQRDKAGVDLAVSDINAFLTSSGYNLQIKVDHEDSATDSNTALQKLQSMAAQGIKVFVGPEWSGAASKMLTYANSNHLVLISQSSTATYLSNRSISTSYLFRLIPDDFAQGRALGRLQTQLGITNVFVIHRDDPYGNGLAASFENRFKALGGTILGDVKYDPATTTDYSAFLQPMKTAIDGAVTRVGASHVAVEAVTFEEGGVLLQQAQSSYPSVLGVTWFGSDGQATLAPFEKTGSAATVAQKIKLISTIYSPTKSSKWTDFVTRFTAATSGLNPAPYGASSYDATWVAVLSILACNKYDGACVQKALPIVAGNYFGPAGWPNLNSAGDRTISDYEIWAVENVSGTPTWVNVGTWGSTADTVGFTQTP